jgi:hypothetical protein
MEIILMQQYLLQPRQASSSPGALVPTQKLVSINDLLPPSFVRRHSNFHDVNHLIATSCLDPEALANLNPSTQRRWDDFTRLNTTFPNWAAMLREARGEWIMRRLGLIIDA